MKIIEVLSYEEMCNKAAEIIIQQIKLNSSSVLGLATGGTPLGIYKKMLQDHQLNYTSYRNIRTVNLDEYVGLAENHPQSYRMYMNEHLFKHVDLPIQQTYLPNGMAKDLAEECLRYDERIQNLGGIDLQLLGIGENGHIGFNEPGTSFQSNTHVIELMDSTRQANARYFSSTEEVPTHAITMGIQSIFKSKKIILAASGHKKANAIEQLLTGVVTEQLPASILKTHEDITLIADCEALSSVKEKYGIYSATGA